MIGSGGMKRSYVGRCDNLARLSCSDTWSNIILDVFVKVFFFPFEEMNI